MYVLSEKIKLTPDEFRLLSLFQTVTTADARDCVIDDKMGRVIFVVNKGQMGMAIGKGGSNIKQLQNVITKKIELVEYSESPVNFIKNIFNSDMVQDVKIVVNEMEEPKCCSCCGHEEKRDDRWKRRKKC